MKVLILSVYLIFQALAQEIAEIKCIEYAQAVYQKETEIFSSRRRGSTEPTSTCAIFENPLIVGGTPARSREFPHMAVIGFAPTEDSDMDWLCGGSLISDKHVLTAAHCTVSQSGPPQKVRLGSIKIDENDDYVQEVKISKFINHPKYKKPVKYHDIAILFLEINVTFSAFVRPACLYTLDKTPVEKAIASGFGKTNYDKSTTSNILLKVELDIIPTDVCEKYLKFRSLEMPENITDGMFCAGHIKGGRDTCQGDSGGPLQVILDQPYCMYGIMGVTSFGRFCGMAYSPGIYTKVYQYVSWIESTVWL